MTVPKTSEDAGQAWGDKGCAYRPDRCQHPPEDGCEWCCMTCNTDRHFCRGCGTVVNHRDVTCGEPPCVSAERRP